MSETTKHIASVLQYLNENAWYALLRNYEGLPEDNSSRDIDIIISRSEYRRCKRELVAILIQGGWQIFSHLDNGRLITFVMAKVTGKQVELVQWDFFADSSVHGIELVTAEEMLSSREFNGTLYHLSKEYEFLDKYLYNRAVSAEYPAKYSTLKSEVKDSPIVKDKLKQLFGSESVERADNMQHLLRSALWCNMRRSPLKTSIKVIGSLCRYMASYYTSDVAPTLAFTGADGAGKTTIIELLKERLSVVYGKATTEFHFRPTLIPNLGEAAHSAGVQNDVDREYDKPHRGAKSGVVSSFIRLCYYTFDYVVGYWARVKPHTRITKVVIFDRYYSDVIVDSRRSSIYLSRSFLYGWGRLFIPQMRYNFLITASVDIILSRKRELDREGIERINANLDCLAANQGYYLIENNGSTEEALTKILTLILEKQHSLNLKRV